MTDPIAPPAVPPDALSDANREIAATWCVRLADGPLPPADRDAFTASAYAVAYFFVTSNRADNDRSFALTPHRGQPARLPGGNCVRHGPDYAGTSCESRRDPVASCQDARLV